MKPERRRFKFAWMALTITGAAILIFGLIVSVQPGARDPLFLRAIGAASIGMGLFGVMIALVPFRRRERWAWFSLWCYPIFWSAPVRRTAAG